MARLPAQGYLKGLPLSALSTTNLHCQFVSRRCGVGVLELYPGSQGATLSNTQARWEGKKRTPLCDISHISSMWLASL